MQVSVITCAHNPRPDYLRRVLAALEAQTLAKVDWELLLVDNGSRESLQGRFDLGWHPQARLLRVEELGKVAALLRGLAESQGRLIVVVDDDNVLGEDYLAAARRISHEWPMLGAWSGHITAEFETPPPSWAKPYLRYLAIREVTRDQWSNFCDPPHFGELPWGAGMCVRREVAMQWAARTAHHALLRKLDRIGKILTCGEDTHMALIACDLGFGTGLFSCLRMTHLIRAERLREPYLLKLMEGQIYSLHILSAIRGKLPARISWPRSLWGHLTALRRGTREFRFHRASTRGARAASTEIASWRGVALHGAIQKLKAAAKWGFFILAPRRYEQWKTGQYGFNYPVCFEATRSIFIHTPRTAGTSIALALYGTHIDHHTWQVWHDLNPGKFKEYFKFAVIRDPLERFISAFYYLKRGGMHEKDKNFADRVLPSFNTANELAEALWDGAVQREVLTGIHFRPQADLVVDQQGRLRMDLLIRFDCLEQGFDAVMRKLNAQRPLPHLNRAHIDLDQRKLTARGTEALRCFYRKDIALFESCGGAVIPPKNGADAPSIA